ncbi:FecR family protein [Klebsiella sp. BIGb0407]|uniref:FecR family protein n=1 Tax=Klebsiella sp. BIGb0407 TaxID=2940603 RepID=UPI0021682A83|nr:FecR family protein [Klebsiella sp. BIGb0407]MCS3431626.1 transmembrane sensor [Klebsiella sp. BIGb0407]
MSNNAVAGNAGVRAEARRWFLTMQNNPSRRQRAACDKWRKSSPEHEESWQAIESVWQDTAAPGQLLAEKEAGILSGYLAVMDKNKARTTRRRVISASVFSLLLVIMIVTGVQNPSWLQNLSADQVAMKGERREILLADGSKVLLDADSAFSVDFTHESRRIHLLRGGAWFDVTPSKTPFIVETDMGNVRVLGTQFDVRLQKQGGVVTLVRGSVAVSTDAHPEPVVIKPGQQVGFNQHGIDKPVSVNTQDATAWHNGRYIFYRTRLADVVREVERYRKGWIVIPSADLADQRVTGSFSLDDTDKALASLQASVGFKMHKKTDFLVIISQ